MAQSGLRTLNPWTDYSAIADLIELSFSDHMDAEGREYINYLRRLAKNNENRPLFDGLENYPTNMDGLVWIENEKLIGNLSMIPFTTDGHRRMLVANIAVQPDFRRLGIAKALTEKSISQARDRKIESVWLHVRDDNAIAIHLYESLGFIKKAIRSTWEVNPGAVRPVHLQPGLHIQKRISREWGFQKTWLAQTYPPEITWNLALHVNLFSPGFWNSVSRFFDEKSIEHWSLHEKGNLAGIVTWEESSRAYDLLWLACDPEKESVVIRNLIPHVIEQVNTTKPMILNYPADRSEAEFKLIGLTNLHRLIWMEKDLS